MHLPIAPSRRLAWAIVIAIAVVSSACGAGTAGSSASSEPSATAAPSVEASTVPSLAPSTAPAPSATPEATATAAPSPSAAAGITDFTAPQLFLLSGVREDLRGHCQPALELPAGAKAGIQCDATEPIDAVGFYLFADRKVMRQTYFAKLAEHGVKPDSGNACMDGSPGESTDIPGNAGYEQRVGCYIDASGIANVRISIPSDVPGQSVYIGVNGTTGDLSAVVGWLNNTQPGMTGCVYCVDLWTDPTGAS